MLVQGLGLQELPRITRQLRKPRPTEQARQRIRRAGQQLQRITCTAARKLRDLRNLRERLVQSFPNRGVFEKPIDGRGEQRCELVG
ncbi:hypothetical protein CQY22_018225 [Mycolicibacterium brumae]|uniref:Uncharacterized protein n=1 Tax=Mycolicibacterium brumae TaxID=85968 RepID=A0A2G5P485_9MYCO|nr:hypothetical protein CQY22_018225 [Mycolicibacterium brumae]RWA17032.1 hypothetical protein MBRU_18850 [Mycolicibacterium brumae DSM 44177]